MAEAREALKTLFGHDDFRDGQVWGVECIAAGVGRICAYKDADVSSMDTPSYLGKNIMVMYKDGSSLPCHQPACG